MGGGRSNDESQFHSLPIGRERRGRGRNGEDIYCKRVGHLIFAGRRPVSCVSSVDCPVRCLPCMFLLLDEVWLGRGGVMVMIVRVSRVMYPLKIGNLD